ncbi:response regulator [Spirochaeta africana]|uniref:Response regulator with CheY-like receiver, AAA-type ATPase, and DNA-binding domains n=1 Tax=Spirochaeta africana (strain ATCC 700263 / DSM 8902 / Z-7692) TaxID=889378 RepID=H9UGX6_SPIAZ|nr:response regulator [Spirochaeta africana]AFG36769.1 response regulator with CheY-like receiver, AAA-type ATPase, and DNA-binding domains [Spirochaeta africana DSM 8902]
MAAHRILVVEDEDAIRLTMRDFLVRKGHEVHLASDGVGAIKMLIDNPAIELMVTDYRMNILGGDYWIKFLQRFLPELPIIVTSGFLRPEFEIPYEVMYKPFDYNELEQHILAMLA